MPQASSLKPQASRLEPLTLREAPRDHRRDLTSQRLTLRAETIDDEKRSVEAVLSTENQVAVFDWGRWGVIDEVLLARGVEHAEQIVLLENHSRWSTDAVLGSVREIRGEGNRLAGRLFFAAGDERADRVWNKVRQGHLTDVSVGYRALEYVDIPPGKSQTVDGHRYTAGDRPLRITTKWKLREVSVTPIGADEGAKTRSTHPSSARGFPMNPKLRKFLESIGLRADASDEQAGEFQSMLSGRNAQIAGILESEGESETSRFMARAALAQLGLDPAEPWNPARQEPADDEAARGATTREEHAGDEAPDEAAIRAEAQRAERDRTGAIRTLAAEAGLDLGGDLVTRAIAEGWDRGRAAEEFLRAHRAGRSESVGSLPVGPGIHSRNRDQDVNVRSLAAGLMIGQGLDPTNHAMVNEVGAPTRRNLTEQDADLGDRLRGMSLPDAFRECLYLDTGRRFRTVDEALDFARAASVSGGTLSYVFGTNVYAKLVEGWDTVGDTTRGWTYEEDVANFLTQEDITFQGSSRLEQLPRGTEATHATVSDSHEEYSIARYARQFVMDEQDIIDDRFGALMGMAAEMGEAAARLRPDLVYALMLENPTMADTGAVFNATAVTTTGGHANLGTAALSSDNMKAAIEAMGAQRDSNGNVLNIMPTHLVVPPDLMWLATELTQHQTLIKLFADTSDPLYSTVNQLAQLGLTPVSDARLNATGVIDPRTGSARAGSATNWFLIKAGRRGIRVVFRRGTGRKPQMRRFVLDRGQWGLGWDVKHDIGAFFADWRGVYKSTGAG